MIYILSNSGSPFRLWFYQIHRSKGWLKSIILSFLMMNNNLMNHNSHKTVPANPPLSQTSRTFQVLDALSHTLTQHAKFFWLYTRWNSLQNIWEQEFVCAFLLTLVRQLQNTTHQTLVKNRNQHRLKIYFKLLWVKNKILFKTFSTLLQEQFKWCISAPWLIANIWNTYEKYLPLCNGISWKSAFKVYQVYL